MFNSRFMSTGTVVGDIPVDILILLADQLGFSDGFTLTKNSGQKAAKESTTASSTN